MRTENVDNFSEVNYEQQSKGKIEFFLEEGRLWKWEPTRTNYRVIAQQSMFVLGSTAIRKNLYKKTGITKDIKIQIIRAMDKKYGISENVLFPDFYGFALSNAHDKKHDHDYEAEDYFNIGLNAQQKGELEEAIESYTKAIQLEYAKAYYNRGSAHYQLGQNEEAIKDYTKYIELVPEEDASAHYNRGLAHYQLGQNEKAIKDWTKYIELVPEEDADAYYNRGLAYNKIGQNEKAIKDWTKYIQLVPEEDADAYYNRGLVHYKIGQHEKATEDYNKAIQLNPDKKYANYGTDQSK